MKENVVPAKKARVIANGSICGVDERRFKPDMAARSEIRKGHSIPESDVVFLFLGRLTVDKGILDLAKAFSMVNKKYLNTRLMIVGPDEEGMKQRVTEICKNCSEHLHFEGYTDVPERYMAASDVFCLPSYREGFGLVVIESAAVGIPSIGSRIYGVTDAIEDGVTGFFSEPAASHDLMLKMARFVENPGLIKTMGQKARINALERYSREKVTSAMVDYYNELEGSR